MLWIIDTESNDNDAKNSQADPSIRSRKERQIPPSKSNGYTPATYQEAISRDLVIALEATERLNKSLDELIEGNGCSEFLASHRLLGEKITSNRNILQMLIRNTMDISIKTDKPELRTKYPDYFTK